MERNVMGELNVYRGSGAKPNFSEIARRHGMDRHTVAKYWREGESAADGRSARGSAFDPLEEVIRAKAQLPGMTKMAVYAFLREGRGEGLPGYGAFTAWCRARDVPFGGAGGRDPHPRFETPPGRQLQFDWKEGMRLVDSEGEVFEFSVFTATLGYSRKHRFIPVRSRTLDDLLSCLLATFTRLGGVPEECITDNMSCLVTVSGRRRTRQERAWRFAREAGFELRLCAPRSPQTKGKDESANRFLNRLLAYGGEFTGWGGLAEAVARVEAQANSEPNRTTGLPPDALFMREKESLRPIGNLRLLESMVGDVSVQTVPPTMLVRAAGREWSVPRRCIGRRVSVIAMPGGQVVVRMAGEEVAVHDAASGPSRPINYDHDHYGQALEGKRGLADTDIAVSDGPGKPDIHSATSPHGLPRNLLVTVSPVSASSAQTVVDLRCTSIPKAVEYLGTGASQPRCGAAAPLALQQHCRSPDPRSRAGAPVVSVPSDWVIVSDLCSTCDVAVVGVMGRCNGVRLVCTKYVRQEV